MTKEKYPNEITEVNLGDLAQKSKKMHYTKFSYHLKLLVLLCVLEVITTLIIAFFLSPFFHTGSNLVSTLFQSDSLPEAARFALAKEMVPLFLVSLLVNIPILYLSYYVLFWGMYKYTGIPSLEESIFADTVIIANHIKNDERESAKKNVKFLMYDLKLFCTLFMISPNRVEYSKEFRQLINGNKAICRMVLFSKDNISQLFTNFGASLVNNNNPKAFIDLNALIGKAKEYGDLKGRLPTVLDRIERYPVTIPTVWSIGVVVFVVVYFLIFGQLLPIT